MITFDIAKEEDIEELIRLRIAYMKDDFGSVSEEEKAGMESQLPDYFKRKLGTELIAFTARDEGRIVSVAYLHIIASASTLPYFILTRLKPLRLKLYAL